MFDEFFISLIFLCLSYSSLISVKHFHEKNEVVLFIFSGERSHFANKMKALHRLKAKLLVIAREQGVSSVGCINRDAITGVWQRQTRRYISHPYKLVHDVKTGIQLPDLNSVLDGNIEPLIGAHINIRQSSDTD